MSMLENMVLVDRKELQDLRAAKIALAAEQRKHRKARDRIAELRLILQKCAELFRFYEIQHLAKTPPDSTKARTNAIAAEMCEAFLK